MTYGKPCCSSSSSINHFIENRIPKNIEKNASLLMIIILKYLLDIGVKATSFIEGIELISICEFENI